MAKWFIIGGAILIIIGILLYFFPGIFNWFGKLHGDIRIESERMKVYIPISSMILIGVVLSLILFVINLLRK